MCSQGKSKEFLTSTFPWSIPGFSIRGNPWSFPSTKSHFLAFPSAAMFYNLSRAGTQMVGPDWSRMTSLTFA
jgi:hypothetical protein